jgi:hypothetical protein
MASRAIVALSLTLRDLWREFCPSGGLRLNLRHLPPGVIPAGLAKMVGTLELTAIRAFGISGRFQRVM